MIRKNPSGDLPIVHESAFVDPTAILCGKVIVEENVFIGFNSVLFNCTVGDGSVVRHNSVVEGCHVPPGFYILSTTNVHYGCRSRQHPARHRRRDEFFRKRGDGESLLGARVQPYPQRILIDSPCSPSTRS